jgi:hypothetical protein
VYKHPTSQESENKLYLIFLIFLFYCVFLSKVTSTERVRIEKSENISRNIILG